MRSMRAARGDDGRGTWTTRRWNDGSFDARGLTMVMMFWIRVALTTTTTTRRVGGTRTRRNVTMASAVKVRAARARVRVRTCMRTNARVSGRRRRCGYAFFGTA